MVVGYFRDVSQVFCAQAPGKKKKTPRGHGTTNAEIPTSDSLRVYGAVYAAVATEVCNSLQRCTFGLGRSRMRGILGIALLALTQGALLRPHHHRQPLPSAATVLTAAAADEQGKAALILAAETGGAARRKWPLGPPQLGHSDGLLSLSLSLSR